MTEDGKQGIVLKIEEPSNAFVALYEPIVNGSMKELKVKDKNIPWQQSVEPIIKSILSKEKPSIFNINGNKSYERVEPLSQ